EEVAAVADRAVHAVGPVIGGVRRPVLDLAEDVAQELDDGGRGLPRSFGELDDSEVDHYDGSSWSGLRPVNFGGRRSSHAPPASRTSSVSRFAMCAAASASSAALMDRSNEAFKSCLDTI